MQQVSGVILMVCAKIASSRDPHLYPGGKSRAGAMITPHLILQPVLSAFAPQLCPLARACNAVAEPVGIVVFSAVMGMVRALSFWRHIL